MKPNTACTHMHARAHFADAAKNDLFEHGIVTSDKCENMRCYVSSVGWFCVHKLSQILYSPGVHATVCSKLIPLCKFPFFDG